MSMRIVTSGILPLMEIRFSASTVLRDRELAFHVLSLACEERTRELAKLAGWDWVTLVTAVGGVVQAVSPCGTLALRRVSGVTHDMRCFQRR